MNRYRIEITELAEQDLENAGDYIAFTLLNPKAALDTVRMDYYRNYKIYYVVDNEKNIVYIIRILHMLVDSRAWLYRTFRVTDE